ncbi:brachyurin [Drosophila eugracilis]|uniref:brachyurin n=1 Tax=Drosophila eugracilis TaxID=29029 RepID=UPI0007E87BD8|nr:brachyurin [Drosophila eugracilis]
MALNFAKSLMLILLAVITVIGLATSDPIDIQGRIISGSQAKLGQFPWQVILKRDEWDDLLCGGSIISSLWVLTAAHCTDGHSSIFLIFGSIQLNNEDAQNMTSTNIFVHPNYNENLNNDVSLIKLPEALTFSSSVQPIQLVTESQQSNTFVGTVAIIAGFGLLDDEYLDYSQTLMYAQVEIIPNSGCLSIFGSNVVMESTLCARGFDGSNMSICSGDSGGPLIIYNTSIGEWQQIGINSFVAEDQCTASYPSGYVRLTSFLSYIDQITSNNI